MSGPVALTALYVTGDYWDRPCRTYHYAPGSPQARAEEIYWQYYAKVPFVGGSEEGYREMLTYPVKAELMNDGWHVDYDAARYPGGGSPVATEPFATDNGLRRIAAPAWPQASPMQYGQPGYPPNIRTW